MENVFYFILKVHFVLQNIQIFAKTFFDMYKNSSIRKLRLVSKFMTSYNGKQTNAIHILPDISRTKGNQTKPDILRAIRQ